jgi:hypothetical protein
MIGMLLVKNTLNENIMIMIQNNRHKTITAAINVIENTKPEQDYGNIPSCVS